MPVPAAVQGSGGAAVPSVPARSSSKLPSKEEGHTHRSKKKGAKAKVNTSHLDVNTQLLEAIEQEKPRVVRRLLESKANPNTPAGPLKQSPLMLANNVQNEESRKTILELLLKKGADVNMQDSSGQTVLMKAVLANDSDTVSTLMSHQCDIRLSDCDGNNVLCHAALSGNEEFVRLFVQEMKRRKLDIDCQNMRGLTALIISCQEGHLEAAKILVLEGGASTTIRDLDNFMSAQDWMKQSGFYTNEELTFLSPGTQKRNYYRKQRQMKGIRTLTDYMSTREHFDDKESKNVFAMRRNSLEMDQSGGPLLPRLQGGLSKKRTPRHGMLSLSSSFSGSQRGSKSMFDRPSRSMFDVPKSQSTFTSLAPGRPSPPRRSSLPEIPFSILKTDLYESSYLTRRKALLNKDRRSDFYHAGSLEPIGMNPSEKISKLTMVQHTTKENGPEKQTKHNSLPPLRRGSNAV